MHRDWIYFDRVPTPGDDEDLFKQTARCKVCGPKSAPIPRFRSETRTNTNGNAMPWKRNLLTEHLQKRHSIEYQLLPKIVKNYE